VTDYGKQCVLDRLTQCCDLVSLRIRWGNLGVAYQRDPDIIAHKDKLKEQMQCR